MGEGKGMEGGGRGWKGREGNGIIDGQEKGQQGREGERYQME